MSQMCPHIGVPVGLNWQTLFPPRSAITYFLTSLQTGYLYSSSSLAFVEERLLQCFEIVTKETSFWTSHFKNISACFHVLSQINPASAALELKLCHRAVFDAVVNTCEFPRPIGDILKGCWGDPSSLNSVLAILSQNVNHVCPSDVQATYHRRTSSIFRLLSPSLTSFKAQAPALWLLLLEDAVKMVNISPRSLNKFRYLMTLTFDTKKTPQNVRTLSTFRPLWHVVDRISRKMPYGRNLSIKLSQLTSVPFDPKATAVHQLIS
ncbi:MAG: hypothetical protein ACTS4U_01205, partial [Candidatus Hodgkinia cicadicola]